jgi:retron-type reverse transcriptase
LGFAAGGVVPTYSRIFMAKANGGAPGVDGKTFDESVRIKGFLEWISQELLNWTYRPMPTRHVEILKSKGKNPYAWDTDCKRSNSRHRIR